MKAMILAAGRGERMRPLTDSLPKPMLTVAGVPLIEHHIRKLAQVGIRDIVINLAWLGEKISDYLDDGSRFGVNISYSWEEHGALETAGGIIKALPLLSQADEPFFVVNGDIFLDYDFAHLPELTAETKAFFWLVDNPEHNLGGDFALAGDKVCLLDDSASQESFTFSGLGLYRPSFFKDYLEQKVMALAPIMKAAIAQSAVKGARLSGLWTDVGTPERLAELNNLKSSA